MAGCKREKWNVGTKDNRQGYVVFRLEGHGDNLKTELQETKNTPIQSRICEHTP